MNKPSDVHKHIYHRVPKYAGSWVECEKCNQPYRGPTGVELINEREALLAVVDPLRDFQGFSVAELLRVVARQINPPDVGNIVNQSRAMWLNDLADKLDKTLSALPKRLK